MINSKLITKVKKLELKINHHITSQMVGAYHSKFKGQGLNFSNVRKYQFGDDVRYIDWNVSARSNDIQLKEFEEERDLNVLIMVDISASNYFGTHSQSKREAAAEIAALFGFTALKNNDSVGLALFSTHIEKYYPPKKGKQHILSCLRDIYGFNGAEKHTNIKHTLEQTYSLLKKPSAIIIISDFQDFHYDQALKKLSKRHTVIPVIIEDPREKKLPNLGFIELEDPETGETLVINTNSNDSQEKYKSLIRTLIADRNKRFRQAKLTPICLSIDQDVIQPVLQYLSS